MSLQEESLEAFRARLYGSAISTYVVCVLVVPLKIWCRIPSGGAMRLGWDDALCVVALVLATGFFFLGLLGLGQDLGKHVGVDVTLSGLGRFLVFLFPEQLLYIICIAANKFCILMFYWRLFSIKARLPLLVMFGVVGTWTVGLIIAVVLSCEPIAAQWDPTIPDAKCSGLRQLYLGGSVPNIVTDLFLLLMPMPYVWGLHARLVQRLMIASIFLLGCFVSVVSIVRLSIMMRIDLESADYTWKMKGVLLWSIVEVNVGLICACLPSLKPTIRLLGLSRIFGWPRSTLRAAVDGNSVPSPAFGARSYSHGRKRGSTGGLFSSLGAPIRLDDEEDSFEMISKSQKVHGTVETRIGTARNSMPAGEVGRDNGLPVINLKRDWSVVIEEKGG